MHTFYSSLETSLLLRSSSISRVTIGSITIAPVKYKLSMGQAKHIMFLSLSQRILLMHKSGIQTPVHFGGTMTLSRLLLRFTKLQQRPQKNRLQRRQESKICLWCPMFNLLTMLSPKPWNGSTSCSKISHPTPSISGLVISRVWVKEPKNLRSSNVSGKTLERRQQQPSSTFWLLLYIFSAILPAINHFHSRVMVFLVCLSCAKAAQEPILQGKVLPAHVWAWRDHENHTAV